MVLAFTIVAEELATYLLAWRPSSEFAWYLNLKFFGIFQRSHSVLSEHIGIPYLQLLFVAVPILFLVWSGSALRLRLPIAIASNLSLAYAFFLAYAWYVIDAPSRPAASLVATAYASVANFSAPSLTSGPHLYVLAALLISSLFSFGASHLLYLRAVRGV